MFPKLSVTPWYLFVLFADKCAFCLLTVNIKSPFFLFFACLCSLSKNDFSFGFSHQYSVIGLYYQVILRLVSDTKNSVRSSHPLRNDLEYSLTVLCIPVNFDHSMSTVIFCLLCSFIFSLLINVFSYTSVLINPLAA